MAALSSILRHVRRIAADPGRATSDAGLLARYARSRDESAFEELLSRHGPLVWGVCTRLLRDRHIAEDAFQATFLVLARRPTAVRRPEALGSWLHGVARRVAGKLRHPPTAALNEQALISDASATPLDRVTDRELLGLLDEELGNLPERLRAPLILCYLDGRTRDEAARALGWSLGTLKRRLQVGKVGLRVRLERRGVTLPAAFLAAGMASAAVPAGVSAATARAASAFLAGRLIGSVPAVTAEALLVASLPTKPLAMTAVLAIGSLALLAAGIKSSATQTNDKSSPVVGALVRPDGGSPRTDRYGDAVPEGAIARLGTARLRHDHPYLHLLPAFSPDGTLLATGGNNEIRLWDPITGKLVREIRDGYGYSRPIFAPDGHWLAGHLGERDSRTVVRLWDPQTGRRLFDMTTDGQVRGCSPDGTQLVTVADDGSISLWDTMTGKRTSRLVGGHRGQASHFAFIRSGKGLVTVSMGNRVTDRSACHWDLAAGRLEKNVELNLPPRIHNACLSPDGQSLVVSPRDAGPVYLLDTATGKERTKLQGELAQAGQGLAFSPDGKTLATSLADLQKWGDQTAVALWDVATGKLLRHFSMPARAAYHLCFTPDGRTLLTAGQQPLVHLWDATTGRRIHSWDAHQGGIWTLAFTPDGTSLVSGGFDGAVRVWDVSTGQHLRELLGHRWGVSGVAVTPNGETIVSAGTDGCIRLQSRDGKASRRILLGRTPEELNSPDHPVYALALSRDGKTAVTYGSALNAGNLYHVWDLLTGRPVIERRDVSKVISSRTFSPDAKLALQLVFTGDAGEIDVQHGKADARTHTSFTLAVLEDVATGKPLVSLQLPKQAGNVGVFAPDGRLILTHSHQDERRKDGWYSDNQLFLWELVSRKSRQTITWSGRAAFVQAALSPDGRIVATARNDQTIQLWDLATSKELVSRQGFLSQVKCLAFSRDGRALASGHADGTILIWDVQIVAGLLQQAKLAPEQRGINDWWSDLAGEDAGKAHVAIYRLTAAGEQTVNWLRDRLEPLGEIPAGDLRSLIADLDSSNFSRRQAATRQLATLADRAGPALRAALKTNISAEQRRRIEEALASLSGVPPGNVLRDLRAVEVLERVGTPEAKRLLEKLASGATEARLTREAKAALERVK